MDLRLPNLLGVVVVATLVALSIRAQLFQNNDTWGVILIFATIVSVLSVLFLSFGRLKP